MGEDLLSLKWNNHRPAFFHLLKTLREKGWHTDVTLACGSQFFAVHRLVLVACSQFFSDVFQHTTCAKPVIVLKDVCAPEMEALLDYMYLGEVDVQQTHLPGLIKAAESLRIKGLAVPDEEPPQISLNPDLTATSNTVPQPLTRTSKRRRKSGAETPSDSKRQAGVPVDGAGLTDGEPGILSAAQEDVKVYHVTEIKTEDCEVELAEDEIKTEPQPPPQLLQQQQLHSDHLHTTSSAHSEDCHSAQHLLGGPSDFQHFLSVDEGTGCQLFGTGQEGNPTNPMQGHAAAAADIGHQAHPHHHNLHHQQHQHQPGPSGLHRAGREESTGDDTRQQSTSAHYNQHLSGEVVNPPESSSQSIVGQAVQITTSTSSSICSSNNSSTNSSLKMSPMQGPESLQCSHCYRTFTDRYKRDRHLLIHTGVKPFKCPFCEYRSSRKDPVIRHVKFKHSATFASIFAPPQ